MKPAGGLALLIVVVPGLAQNPFDGKAREIETGRGIFRIYCSPCHGIRAEGGRGPDLTRGVYAAGKRDEDLFRVIANGSEGTDMRGYREALGDAGIWRIVAYLRTAARRDTERAAGNAAAGEALFWGKGACGTCHRVGRRGGRVGPDLSMAGRQRSVRYLRESVVSPDADITPGFATIEVVTEDGKKIRGVERGYDNFSAQMFDAGENYHSYLKSEVRSLERVERSMMPGTYAKLFSAGELDDLVAWLQTLGRTEEKR